MDEGRKAGTQFPIGCSGDGDGNEYHKDLKILRNRRQNNIQCYKGNEKNECSYHGHQCNEVARSTVNRS